MDIVDQQPQGSTETGWKWIAGLLALGVVYQAGFEQGRQNSPGSTSHSASASGGTGSEFSAFDYSAPLPAGAPATLAPIEPIAAEPVSAAPDYDLEEPEPTTVAAPPAYASAAPAVAPASRPSLSSPTALDELDASEPVTTAQYRPDIEPAPATRSPANDYRPAIPGPACAENGSCYGDISTTTGRPRTTHVRGYFRRDGTYVRGHYRSRR